MVIREWLSYVEEPRSICKLECRVKWGAKRKIRRNIESQIREIKSTSRNGIKDKEDVRRAEEERIITQEAVWK